jgi:poly(3-hydroxybutyrate) depolymerase
MYLAYQTATDLITPWRMWSRLAAPLLAKTAWDAPGLREWTAALKTFDLGEITHHRPAWNIDQVMVNKEWVPVQEDSVLDTAFCTLRRFRRESTTPLPQLLVVAPMSGHFATLLRDTVRTAVQDHDVFVTDWHNVRDVPLEAGRFGLDEYTELLMEFIRFLGPNSHVLAVCQPCVSALCAVALMAEDQDPATPASLTLMAGPIDCRISPTEVNRLATSKPITWFEERLISTVPARFAGAGRRVYPGFVQLSAFMSMNRERHLNAFREYYSSLVKGELDKAQVTRTFYEEYLAVADLSADFYLDTVRLVFQDYALPRGEMKVKGRKVNPDAIRRTALVTIEGERDDICAVGQTLAAQDLAPHLRSYLRTHYVQPNVGHYGVFSGRRWQHHIYPLVRNVIHISR